MIASREKEKWEIEITVVTHSTCSGRYFHVETFTSHINTEFPLCPTAPCNPSAKPLSSVFTDHLKLDLFSSSPTCTLSPATLSRHLQGCHSFWKDLSKSVLAAVPLPWSICLITARVSFINGKYICIWNTEFMKRRSISTRNVFKLKKHIVPCSAWHKGETQWIFIEYVKNNCSSDNDKDVKIQIHGLGKGSWKWHSIHYWRDCTFYQKNGLKSLWNGRILWASTFIFKHLI